MLSILSSLGGGLMTALPALFLGGSSIAGGLIGGAMNAKEASKTRKWQAEQNKIQREWLTEMSNTAHQREVDDLRAAGLNPLLSGKYGGASTPSYSGQSSAPADVGSMVAKGMSGAVENVLGMYNAVNNAKLTRAQASLADANAVKALSDSERNSFRNWQEMQDFKLAAAREQREIQLGFRNLDVLYGRLEHEHDVEQRKILEARIKAADGILREKQHILEQRKQKLQEMRFENQKRQELYENIIQGINTVAGPLGQGFGFGFGAGMSDRLLYRGKGPLDFLKRRK